jgi:hypothetical protein
MPLQRGGLSQNVLEHRQRSVNVFAVEANKVEGRHSDQSNRHHAEHDRKGYALVVNKSACHSPRRRPPRQPHGGPKVADDEPTTADTANAAVARIISILEAYGEDMDL